MNTTTAISLRRRLWLCLEITRQRRLSARRNPSFRQNQTAKVIFAIGAVLSILYLIFIAVLLALAVGSDSSTSAPGVLCGVIPVFIACDMFMRFMLQNPPAMLVRPYLLLPIPRRICVDAFVGASVLSTGNLVTQALVTPYVLMAVVFSSGVIPALLLILFFWMLSVLCNQLVAIIRVIIDRNFYWILLPVAIGAFLLYPLFIGPEAGINSLMDTYSTIGFMLGDSNPLPVLVLTALLVGAVLLNRELQFREVLSEVVRTDKKPSSTAKWSAVFLGRNSLTGIYRQLIANTYMRCKNPRKSLITTLGLILVFVLISALTTIYDSSGSDYFWCLYNYLLIAIVLSNSITGFEGNYFDFLAVHRENVLMLLKAKYQLCCLMQLLPFLLMLIPVVAGKWPLFMVVALGIFTCGPVYCLSFQMAVYNKQTMPLNASIAGGRQQNSYLNIIISLATFGIPYALNALLQAIAGDSVAYSIELVLGLLFIVTHDLWLRNIYHRMAARRYTLLQGFRSSKM